VLICVPFKLTLATRINEENNPAPASQDGSVGMFADGELLFSAGARNLYFLHSFQTCYKAQPASFPQGKASGA
jgi:hypothetical protein